MADCIVYVDADNQPAALARQDEVGDHVTLWQPAHGGHVGFPSGRPPGHVMTMPKAVLGWLLDHA